MMVYTRKRSKRQKVHTSLGFFYLICNSDTYLITVEYTFKNRDEWNILLDFSHLEKSSRQNPLLMSRVVYNSMSRGC